MIAHVHVITVIANILRRREADYTVHVDLHMYLRHSLQMCKPVCDVHVHIDFRASIIRKYLQNICTAGNIKQFRLTCMPSW